MHVLGPPEVLERLREERVRVPVVERHVGRRPQDDEHARRVDAEPLEQRPVGLEVGEVVLLLQPRVLHELRRPDAVRLAGARPGSRPARRPSSPRGSRAGAGASRTRSRTSSSSGSRAAAPRSSARASRARARRRSRGRAPTSAARRAAASSAAAFCTRDRPACRPITASASRPCSSSSSSVCA